MGALPQDLWGFVRISRGALTGLPRTARAHLGSRRTPETQARATDDGRRTTSSGCPRGGARTQLPPGKQKLERGGRSAHARRLDPAGRRSSPTQAHLKGRRAPVGHLLPRGCACVGPLGRAPSPVEQAHARCGAGAGWRGRGGRLRPPRWRLRSVPRLRGN